MRLKSIWILKKNKANRNTEAPLLESSNHQKWLFFKSNSKWQTRNERPNQSADRANRYVVCECVIEDELLNLCF